MKELEFRVWSDYWKKYATEAELYMDGLGDAVFETEDGIPHHENTDLIIELFTGLRDKNGKKIWVGDVVKVEDDKYTNDHDKFLGYNATVIKSILKPGAFVVKNWWGERVLNWDIKLSRVEVIGNVHLNPELLEEKE